ncbi:MAG: globin domain-containing protein, partial [Pseudomonadota bacterium]
LFKGDMTEQGAKLMGTLAVVVNGLRAPETIIPAAEALAVRHLDYGVTAAHYDDVGTALLWTLERGLGDQFTAPVKSAWTEAYGLVSGVMIDAAYPQAAE